jgi:hypothetical protein
MKKTALFYLFILGGCLFFALSGCKNEADDGDEGGTELTITAIENGEPEYYSLSTGQKVTGAEIAGPGWDIAFGYNRMIYTNSGDTAVKTGSGGQGGVWASDSTRFSGVKSPDGADFTLPLATDATRWTQPAAEMGDPLPNELNVISYAGYSRGTGESVDDPLTGYQYNAQQYYKADLSTMPPVFSLTLRVYIIRHGDGEHYSKVQITSMDSLASTRGNRRIFIIRYENFY